MKNKTLKQKYPKVGGYYYHFKHDPKEGFNHHAYEIINIGHDTEIKGLAESATVIYAPLYEEANVYLVGQHFNVRPLNMFMEKVIKDGKTFDRFKRITDKKLIAKLKAIQKKMYKN